VGSSFSAAATFWSLIHELSGCCDSHHNHLHHYLLSAALTCCNDDDCFYYHSWRNNVVIGFCVWNSLVFSYLASMSGVVCVVCPFVDVEKLKTFMSI